jgi:uncharacterized phage-like protein YoqJ
MEFEGTRAHTCCFTGHRVFARSHADQIRPMLERAVRTLIAGGYYRFVAGGALGFDTVAAETILSLRDEFQSLRLVVVAPFLGQAKGWREADRFRYERICSAADDLQILGAGYHRGCMRVRNQAMVDMSSFCLAYLNHRPSGTAQTVDYAFQNGLPVVNIADLIDAERPIAPERPSSMLTLRAVRPKDDDQQRLVL